jgi:hypothetical protein
MLVVLATDISDFNSHNAEQCGSHRTRHHAVDAGYPASTKTL